MTIISKTKYEASIESATRKKLARITGKAAEFPSDRMNARLVIWRAVLPGKNLRKVMLG